jgi:hypothetical protein
MYTTVGAQVHGSHRLYLPRIHFAADGYAQLIRLPQYRVADVTVDPDHAFGGLRSPVVERGALSCHRAAVAEVAMVGH